MVGQKYWIRTVAMQSVSIIAKKDFVLEPFLLTFIYLQLDASGCVLINCRTLSSSILPDTRVTKIWHILLKEIVLFFLVSTTIDCRFLFLFTTVKPSPLVLEDFWQPTICDRRTELSSSYVRSYETDSSPRDW